MPKLAIFYQQIIPLIPSLKKNYFNPMEFFDEIIFFSFDRELSNAQRDDIAPAFGNARVLIEPIGGIATHNILQKRKKILHHLMNFHPDIIRAYSPQVDGYLATYSANLLGIPSIISLHGDRDRDNRYNMLNERKYYHYMKSLLHKQLYEKKSMRSCTHIIAVYEFAAEYGRRYSKIPVTIIYNQVDTDQFYPDETEDRAIFTVINIGRLIPAKKQDTLIKAMKWVDGKLLLVGNGPEHDNLKNMATQIGVSEKVEIIQSIKYHEIPRYLRKADVYATAIQYGGIAIPVMEAMASGLPIIQCPSPFQEKPEFIDGAGLIVENSPESFAEGINHLKENPVLRKKMSEFARQKMQANNSSAMERLEIEVYRKVMKK